VVMACLPLWIQHLWVITPHPLGPPSTPGTVPEMLPEAWRGREVSSASCICGHLEFSAQAPSTMATTCSLPQTPLGLQIQLEPLDELGNKATTYLNKTP
jgi:hypothetical protein